MYALNRRVPVGVAGDSCNFWGSAISVNPSPFPFGLETSRDLHSVVVRDPGLPFGL
jgi:hypothetical protein